MRGVNTQVSEPKSNTACTTALKKNPDTCGSAPYLLNILFILFHTTLALENLLTTAVQLLYDAKINRPTYPKEVTKWRAFQTFYGKDDHQIVQMMYPT